MGIFLGSLLYNIGLGVFLCGSIVRFCLKLGIALSLAFSFCFDHLGSSCFYVNFLIGYSSSVMTTIGIFMERPCNLWIFLNNRNKYCKNSHFYSINYINAQEWEVFTFFSSVFLPFFLKYLKVFTVKAFPLFGKVCS